MNNRRQMKHRRLPVLRRNPFRIAAERLIVRWAPEKTGSRSGGRTMLHEEITALSAGKQRERAIREYYVDKWTLILMLSAVMLVGILLLLPLIVQAPVPVPKKGIQRPDYTQSAADQELIAQIEDAEHPITVQIQPRKHSDLQVQELLEKGKEELEDKILGDNASADEVRTPLCFLPVLAAGQVQAEYLTVPYGLISQDGSIMRDPKDQGEIVEITASLKCQGQELLYKRAVKVLPILLEGKEKLQRTLKRTVQEAEQEQAESEYFVLPDRAGENKISWKYPVNDSWKSVLLLMIFVIPAVCVGKDMEVHRKAAQRREQLETDYPELLWNMTILLGAGMTIRSVFYKLASSYENKGKTRNKRYAYEEVCYTCREMQSGVSEAQAYERFGKRCGLQSYIKLGSLLAQNMKKGSGGLARLLQTEATLSLEEQKRLARKHGENAQTKILFPMVLMLGVVMLMLMVPAFMGM